MCGFIGMTGSMDKHEYDKVLNHRGPDNVGFYTNNKVSLIHFRLSIIDISDEANQPFISENNNVLIFNGEIYNYKEIIKKYNLKCTTSSDTEVILRLYDTIGLSFINELNGIFSFAIYDNKKDKIFLYRDRFGIKPLYYKFTGKSFSFSSEAKALVTNEDSFNLQTVYEYLELGLTCHNENTFFENIHSLEAAHFIEYDCKKHQMNVFAYWELSNDIYQGSYDEIVETTYDLLNDSLKLNLVSDVEVAISLSSGTDSTLLTKLAQGHQQDFKAFTFGFNEKDYDEVMRVKQNFDLSNLELYPTYLQKEDMLSTLKESIHFFETPLGGLGTLSAYNMMSEVKKQNIRVILAGEGSDEIFGGYKYYYPAFFNDIKDEELLVKELDYYNHKHKTSLRLGSQECDAFMALPYANKVLAPDGTSSSNSHIGKILEGYQSTQNRVLNRFEGLLANTMYQDMFVKKLPKLLHFQDRSSMAHSVEARVPFLDYRLVEFLYSLPATWKIKNGETKFLLKEILRKKYQYNERVETKHYVATPQREWIKDKSIQKEILETVRYSKINKNGIINFDKFLKDYNDYAQISELGNSFFVWKIINLTYLMENEWT